jgi:membrane-associated phospholipid phosphatase
LSSLSAREQVVAERDRANRCRPPHWCAAVAKDDEEEMNTMHRMAIFGIALVLSLGMCRALAAQEVTPPTSPAPDSREGQSTAKTEGEPKTDTVTESSKGSALRLGERFIRDQREIWTSPARLRFSDAEWLVPLSGITAALFVTDRDFSKHLSQNPTTIGHYKTLSNAGAFALVGGAGGMWVLGHASHDQHLSETGFLAGEATLNTLVMVEALKYSLRRERPFQGDGSGRFFQSGGTSFPSEHAAAAWSVAGIVAHEYPGPLSKIMAYGLASLVSVSRVKAHQHFPADVLVGSVMGNLVAQNIYSRHHDRQLSDGEWRSIGQIFRSDETSSPANHGSPYVALDSWIYPALDRLTAMGLIDSAFEGMKPWTRAECVRLLQEASGSVGGEGRGGPEAEKIYRLLKSEFREELEAQEGNFPVHGKVESVYARVTEISGSPLTDGNHFGQTLINDFGRPYQEGFNSVDGFSAWTTAGPWVGYVRAEYQHSPSAPAQPDSTRQFIAGADALPGIPPATPFSALNRVRLLDGYVGLNLDNWQISFGKQSLWWSPAEGGPLMLSDNAAPMTMFRINRVSPFTLPRILGWLGPIRLEFFIGQLEGHQFVFQTDTGIVGQFGRSLSRQPFVQGQKISLKPTPNFEFSVSATTVFAGGPTPLTWHNFINSYSLGNTLRQGGTGDPGDRRSGVDFSYRIPGMRSWLTFYGDAFDEDEFSPLAYPRKSAIRGGLYMPRIPGVPKLDVRVEGGSTVPPDFSGCNGCFYVNGRYPDGSYTNQGNLMGSWLGRGGQGEQAWSTYWLTSRNKIQFSYRHHKVSTLYLPQGATANDAGARGDVWLGTMIQLSGSVQYEKWNFPVLNPLPRSNVTTSLQFTFWPRSWR